MKFELSNIQNQLSSLEIAAITGKPHNDVLKAIRTMEVAWVEIGQGNFSQTYYSDSQGKQQPQFQLTKTECLYVATKFNDQARGKLIVRWAELEVKEKSKLPQTFSEALQLAADQAKKLELQAPKVEFAENILESETCISVGNLAKTLGFGRNRFFKMLRDDKILISKGENRNTPYQKYIDSGYFELTERSWSNGEGITFVTKITPKGQQYLTSKYGI